MTTRTQELRSPTPPPPRRRPWLIAVATVLVLVIALGATLLVARRKPTVLAQLRVRNTAVSVASKTGALAKGTEGEALSVGDVVQTDGSGQAQVDYFDGSLTRLDSDTRFVIQELQKGPNGRRISLDVKAGRTWNRVARLTSSSDRYEVHMASAVATVRGTTFIADCKTRAPRCFIIGIEDTTHVTSEDGSELDVADGDCVELTPDGGLKPCDAKKLKLLDEWVKENKIEDELIGLPNIQSPTPTPSPTPTERVFRRRRPTPTPRRTLPPLPTENPNDTPRPNTPEPTPKKTPKPTPEPTATACTVPPAPSCPP